MKKSCYPKDHQSKPECSIQGHQKAIYPPELLFLFWKQHQLPYCLLYKYELL